MDIRDYLDATYLKTPTQAGLTTTENEAVVRSLVEESITEGYKLVMIRPDMVPMAVGMVRDSKSALQVGNVIDFPDGDGGLHKKLVEATSAIEDGADELDFVADYKAFKKGVRDSVAEEILECTRLCLQKGRLAKWIIEIAALDDEQIISFCELIKSVVTANADETEYNRVYVKSSTGFYKTEGDKPNGATPSAIALMVEHAAPLPVKAAGGVRSYDEAIEMIKLGVMRIGTSSAKAIAEEGIASGDDSY